MTTNFVWKGNGALRTAVRVSLLGSALGLGFVGLVGAAHAACQEGSGYKDIKQPLFGDLHVHTSYSFDANFGDGTQNDPWDAYQFAKGKKAVSIASFKPGAVLTYDTTSKSAMIDRPLDFAAVTDHDGFLDPFLDFIYVSETKLCSKRAPNDPEAPIDMGIYCPHPIYAPGKIWDNIQLAANKANKPCHFTAFIGYEWTKKAKMGEKDTALGITWDNGSELHRNVIFRNDIVPLLPITTTTSTTPSQLWTALDKWKRGEPKCANNNPQCQVMTIPHNPNLSKGFMFPSLTQATAVTLDARKTYATQRRDYEPVMEIIQNKGASECTKAYSNDEGCGFEERNIFKNDEAQRFGKAYARQSMVTGLLDFVTLQSIGALVNPYQLGFIGSTDTHNATPGEVREDTWQGHQGALDSNPAYRLADATAPEVLALLATVPQEAFERLPRTNPGGLAVVWAQENTREQIFDAVKQRETYATSGPRINLRVFGGFGIGTESTVCGAGEQWIKGAYGTPTMIKPMGGDLSSRGRLNPPKFYINVSKDPQGLKNNLEKIEIVKGWVDANNQPQTRVTQVFPDPLTTPALTSSILNANCSLKTPVAPATEFGFRNKCKVWTDPAWGTDIGKNGVKNVSYYVRVSEIPSCRWSKYDKNKNSNVVPTTQVPDVIRERAWSSPIWLIDKP